MRFLPAMLAQFIPPVTDNLTIKDQFFLIIASFLCIVVVVISTDYVQFAFQVLPTSPLLVASMGASLVILFLVPQSPLAQPWAFIAGQLVSAVIGVTCALYITPFAVACASAVSGSILAMLALRCLHPPGAATALAPVVGGSAFITLGYDFVLIPVTLNVFITLIIVIVVNRWCLKRNYPSVFKKSEPAKPHNLSTQDVQHALKSSNEFIDVDVHQLHQLLVTAQQEKFKRINGNMTCSDIMTANVLSVEYGTEVEVAWQLMYSQKLKAIPVVDKANRIIGIVTWADFFKFVELSPYVSFQEKFLGFIRRTSAVTTDKPEVVGHIMNKQVVFLPEITPITELIDLFSRQKHQQIPIVNDENRLVGMVFQTDLITALNDKILSI